DPHGVVLACGLSTGQRVVRVGDTSDAFIERLTRMLAPPAAGWLRTRLRVVPRPPVAWLQKLRETRDAMVVEGDWLDPERDCVIVGCAGVERMSTVISSIGKNVRLAQL